MPRGCGFCQVDRRGPLSSTLRGAQGLSFFYPSPRQGASSGMRVFPPVRRLFPKRAGEGAKLCVSSPWTEALSFMHFYTFIFLHICVFAYFGEKGRVPAFFCRARAPRMPAAASSRQQKTGEAFASPVFCLVPPRQPARRGGGDIGNCSVCEFRSFSKRIFLRNQILTNPHRRWGW